MVASSHQLENLVAASIFNYVTMPICISETIAHIFQLDFQYHIGFVRIVETTPILLFLVFVVNSPVAFLSTEEASSSKLVLAFSRFLFKLLVIFYFEVFMKFTCFNNINFGRLMIIILCGTRPCLFFYSQIFMQFFQSYVIFCMKEFLFVTIPTLGRNLAIIAPT